MSDTDDSWLDALAGRSADAAAADSNPEGASLRAAIQAREAAPVEVAIEDAQREALLIERARTAGLLQAGARSGGSSRRARLPLWSGWLAAAGLACVFVTTWELRQHPKSPVVRGSHTGVLRLQSADPVKLKQDLLRDLAAAGVAAKGYERFGHQGVDADLPTPLPPALRDVLQRHGIAAPEDGVLQVEIDSGSGP